MSSLAHRSKELLRGQCQTQLRLVIASPLKIELTHRLNRGGHHVNRRGKLLDVCERLKKIGVFKEPKPTTVGVPIL